MKKKTSIKELELRANMIRKSVIQMLAEAKSGHTAGSLGMADIFTALYGTFLHYNPKKPTADDRDYLILSCGHICPVLYATLSSSGFFPEKELLTLRKLGSRLQGHPERNCIPGIETTSGPLGQGISQAAGIALGLRLDKKKNKVVCITSDGEHQEGQVWEAALFIAHQKLDIINIIDRNYIQIGGNTEDSVALGSLKEKYDSFGWNTLEIDGNKMEEIVEGLTKAFQSKGPVAIIANTVPGKGVSFMEHDASWHGRAPNPEQAKEALNELTKIEEGLKK
ncbi:transketolase [Candidatus Woesearchaeota archaeon]|nr:transketolase [Candidatus Woesearchaeota archaeon]